MTDKKEKEFLTADQIIAVEDLPIEQVRVPEWGDTWVNVRGLSGTQRSDFESSIMVMKKGRVADMKLTQIREKLVSLCLVDLDGNRLFKDSQMKALGNKSAAALDRIFVVAQRLSGLSDDDVDELAADFFDAPN